MNVDTPVVGDSVIWDTWMTMLNVPAVSSAMHLDIFESLNESPASAPELAERKGYDARVLNALLALLMNLGYLNEYDGRFQLTATAKSYLLKDSPFYWGGVFAREGRMQVRHGLLLEAITGKKEKHDGRDRPADSWESGEVDMDMAREITAFMHSHSMAASVGMTKTIDFSGAGKVLDVGGGSACFSIALAKLHSNIRCTVMELPAVCKVAEDYIADAGVPDQVNTVTVDMFRQDWPAGYDTHFFSNIFHDWSFETCRKIAKSSFDALPSGGKILLHEMLLRDGGKAPPTVVSVSLLMAVGTLGQQFTFPQLQEILQSAGFVNISSEPSYGYYSVIKGEKPA